MGGGICISGGSLADVVIRGCEISNNIGNNSGGISIRNAKSVLIDNSKIIENNSTYQGGGIRISNGVVTLQNSIIAKNNASNNSYGNGAISKEGGTLNIINCVVADNAQNSPSNIKGLWGTANVYNTIFYNNKNGDFNGAQTTFYNNITTTIPSFTNGGSNITNTAGLFVDAATGDYTLASGSPALNAGKQFVPGTSILFGSTDIGISGNNNVNNLTPSVPDLGTIEADPGVLFKFEIVSDGSGDLWTSAIINDVRYTYKKTGLTSVPFVGASSNYSVTGSVTKTVWMLI
jgi:hypothetical protein